MAINWRHVKFNIIGWTVLPLGILFLRMLVRTYRMDAEARARCEELLAEKHLLIVTLHGMSLGTLGFIRQVRAGNRRAVVLTSPSRDGQVMDALVRPFGIRVVKGSSRSKSIEGARGMIEAIREGDIALLTPDGPRGPLFVPKSGFIRMAPAAGARVRVLAIGASRSIQFGSWDRLFLPLPFARLTLAHHEFVYTEPETPEQEEAILKRMQRELIRVGLEVDCPITRGVEVPPE